MSVAVAEDDPLQCSAVAMASGFVNDPWVVRRLPALVQRAGLVDVEFRSHGYGQVAQPLYMLSIIDRGADALMARGVIGAALAAALKGEARRRDEESGFFGHIAYASLLARKA